MSVPFFVLAALGFGFVIFIHELGHFLFAKWAGVRVEVFSIGFGPRLITKRIGETEYSLSLLPLGGYVKMTGQEDLPEDPDQPASATTAKDARSFLNAHAGWKSAILLGGVLFNFLSSYALMLCLAFYGLPVLRPVISDIQTDIRGLDGVRHPSPAAELGLRPGDRVLSINGEKVRSFEDLSTGAIVAGRHPIVLTVQRPGVAEPLTLPAKGTVTAMYDSNAGRPVLGLELPYSTRLTNLADLPPELSGKGPLRTGDRIVALGGTALSEDVTGQELHERLAPSFGQQVAVSVVDSSGARRDTSITYAGSTGATSCSWGLPVQLAVVNPGSPAAEAGLKPGDVIASVDGIKIAGPEHFLALIRNAMTHGGQAELAVLRRDGTSLTARITGREIAGRVRIGTMPETQARGILPLIAPALDGQPAAAAAAEIKAGDAVVTSEPDPANKLNLLLTVVRGGQHVTIPLSAKGAELAAVSHVPGKLAKAFGETGETSLIEQLTGVRVEAATGPDGKATGSPLPGGLIVRTAGGSPRTLDLRKLGADGETLIAGVQAGDWICGIGPDGAWDIVRGATGPAKVVALKGRPLAQPLVFDLETVPYRLESPLEAFAIANRATHTMIWKSLQFIPKFFQPADQGGLDAKKSLQGPIGIFDELRLQAEHFGLDSFLKLVALIGLNLVLVNLLPIPITDGGQLVFLAIETAIGRPLPNLVRTIAAWIGLGLVVALMLFVTTLDIVRRL
jgi:regulator of sigma E protease